MTPPIQRVIATVWIQGLNIVSRTSFRPSATSVGPIAPNRASFYAAKTGEFMGWRQRNGRIYLLCPIHNERTPSCVIYGPDRTKCYGCGWEGTLADLEDFCKWKSLPPSEWPVRAFTEGKASFANRLIEVPF